jgi:hypothetical protein
VTALEQEVMGGAQPGGIAARLSGIEESILGALDAQNRGGVPMAARVAALEKELGVGI